tara:strand:+ start:8109 stop:9089 length:981 start_codon:yes stop_codon:yes gene_type:complete
MDLYTSNVSARASGSRRREEVVEYNEYIQNQMDDRQARINDLEDARLQEQDLNKLVGEGEAIKSGVTGTINVGVAKNDYEKYIDKTKSQTPEERANSGLINKVRKGVKSKFGRVAGTNVVSDTSELERASIVSRGRPILQIADDVADVDIVTEGFRTGGGVSQLSDLTNEGQMVARGEGLIEDGVRASKATRVLSGLGKAVGGAGSMMNIGMGGYDAIQDIEQGKLVGDTWEAQVSNGLQIASGALDLIGMVTGQPEIMALGALAGIGSSIFNEAGELDSESARVKDTDTQYKKDENKITEENQAPKLNVANAFQQGTSESARVMG